MATITYTITIECEDENVAAEAASELEDFAVNVANSYEGVTVDVAYVPAN